MTWNGKVEEAQNKWTNRRTNVKQSPKNLFAVFRCFGYTDMYVFPSACVWVWASVISLKYYYLWFYGLPSSYEGYDSMLKLTLCLCFKLQGKTNRKRNGVCRRWLTNNNTILFSWVFVQMSSQRQQFGKMEIFAFVNVFFLIFYGRILEGTTRYVPMPISCNNSYTIRIRNIFGWRISETFRVLCRRTNLWIRHGQRTKKNLNKREQKNEQNVNMNMIFPVIRQHRVQRAFTEWKEKLFNGVVALSTLVARMPAHTQTHKSSASWIQLRFLENAKVAVQSAATTNTFILLHDSRWVLCTLSLSLCSDSAFMVLHSIKFDFYCCTIKMWMPSWTVTMCMTETHAHTHRTGER